jgi:hypothetical protein
MIWQQLSAPLAICSQLQLVRSMVVMVRCTLAHRVVLYDTYLNYGSVRKCRLNFMMKEFPADKQFTVWRIN